MSEDEELSRKNATYRIDPRITDVINQMAVRHGMSANQFVESHFIEYSKKQGLLPKDFQSIGDVRGKKPSAEDSPGKQAYILLAQSKKRQLTQKEIQFVIKNLPEYQFLPEDFL